MRGVKSTNSLKNDYKYCENIIKKGSKSFYQAFKQLPSDKANAVYAIYAFCRCADDSIDETSNQKQQLENWISLYKQLQLFEKGEEVDHPIWRALRDVFTRYKMDITPFYDQLKGQYLDIHFKQPKDMKELESYCYYVAGTVGLMLLPILATEYHKHLQPYAIHLGTAMQLTNILRDIGEDYQNNRIYLPMNLLLQEQYTEEDLANSVINPSFIRIWEHIAKRSEELYKKFQEGIYYFDKDSQIHVLLSAHIYREILGAVRGNNYDCFHMRNYVSYKKMLQLQKEASVLINGEEVSG